MIQKILKYSHLFLLSIFIITTIFFSGNLQVNAAQNIKVDNTEIILSEEIEDSSKMIDNLTTSASPDLGDDQTFPFIPGFGKNSGKD